MKMRGGEDSLSRCSAVRQRKEKEINRTCFRRFAGERSSGPSIPKETTTDGEEKRI